MGSEGKESWSSERSRTGDQDAEVRREAGEGAATSTGKGCITFRAGTVQGRRRHKRMVAEKGGAGLQKQVGLHVHESKHLQRFIENPRKNCWLKSRNLCPNHLTSK